MYPQIHPVYRQTRDVRPGTYCAPTDTTCIRYLTREWIAYLIAEIISGDTLRMLQVKILYLKLQIFWTLSNTNISERDRNLAQILRGGKTGPGGRGWNWHIYRQESAEYILGFDHFENLYFLGTNHSWRTFNICCIFLSALEFQQYFWVQFHSTAPSANTDLHYYQIMFNIY